MNTRLQQFLSFEQITQTQFAQTLGVTNASISHILSGRNKPGYDFLVSIAVHYPDLNMEWLLLGEGSMYKSHKSRNDVQDDLFPEIRDSREEKAAEPEIPANVVETAGKSIRKVIVFYSDNTFRELE